MYSVIVPIFNQHSSPFNINEINKGQGPWSVSRSNKKRTTNKSEMILP